MVRLGLGRSNSERGSFLSRHGHATLNLNNNGNSNSNGNGNTAAASTSISTGGPASLPTDAASTPGALPTGPRTAPIPETIHPDALARTTTSVSQTLQTIPSGIQLSASGDARPEDATATTAATDAVTAPTTVPASDDRPPIGSIRFVPHIEYTSRQTLNFEPMERKVVDSTHIKLGRFNDKSQNKMSITFKSKVVSRSHAEVWCEEGGAWYIRDVKSSSGTFLNHIRLSPPGVESAPTRLNDGDCIQFGIDFRGGTEEVYRCVRTRLEINRVFQQTDDTFNRQAHRHLKALTSGGEEEAAGRNGTSGSGVAGDTASVYSAECCICLFSIAPAQALFVAPCSHTYHFKCIRPLILQTYPAFMCCVCRKYADLEASVEVESASWLTAQKSGDPRTPGAELTEYIPITSAIPPPPPADTSTDPDLADQTTSLTLQSPLPPAPAQAAAAAAAAAVAVPTPPLHHTHPRLRDLNHQDHIDGTPRNTEGPFLIAE